MVVNMGNDLNANTGKEPRKCNKFFREPLTVEVQESLYGLQHKLCRENMLRATTGLDRLKELDQYMTEAIEMVHHAKELLDEAAKKEGYRARTLVAQRQQFIRLAKEASSFIRAHSMPVQMPQGPAMSSATEVVAQRQADISPDEYLSMIDGGARIESESED